MECPSTFGLTEKGLRDGGWVVGYELPVHLIPARDEDWRARLFRVGADHRVAEVGAAELPDFAWLQDQAYHASYDLPRGCLSLFYADLASVAGPETVAALLYDQAGTPVRAAQLVRSRGITHGIAGAALPAVRGQHLGEELMHYLTAVGRERLGADDIVHVTMPVARPIAVRLGLAQVATWRRWVKGRRSVKG